MTRFSDQLSTVRQAQLEAQLDMFRNLTSRALDSAGQIAALNVRASRASMEQAAGTMKYLLEARDPRDLLALGSAAQGQWHTLFSYGRELFGLAVGAHALPATIPLLAAPAPTANLPTTYTQVIDQVSIATDAAAVDIGTAQAEAAIEVGTAARTQTAPANAPESAPVNDAASEAADAQLAAAEAAIDTAIADDVPPAEPTPLAKALSEVSPKPAGAEHPLASTVPFEADDQIELPAVRPQESVARAKPSRGPRRK